MKIERNHLYDFYLYCEPYLLLLEDESIIDASIFRGEKNKKENSLVIQTEDKFFFDNLNLIKQKDFFIVLQTFEVGGLFSHQFEFFGEEFFVSNDKVTFIFQSLTTNHICASLNPFWKNAINLYKSERVSYIRNSKIENVLNNLSEEF